VRAARVLALLGAFASATLSAGQQVRDSAASPVGSSIVSGVVMSDETASHPVRRATINVSGGPLRSARITVTDDAGRFAITGLPAGAYSLKVSKTGWVDTWSGGKRPGRGPGVPVAVAAGERATVTIRMPRGAVIAGTITDERGQPAPNAGFQLLQFRMVNGERTLVTAYGGYGYTTTDDRGMYRIYGLAPGEYLVAVTGWSGFSSGEWRSVTPEEVSWAQRAGTAATDTTPPPPRAPALGYAPIYYPGTPDAMSATPVVVTAGDERLGIDFAIRAVATSRIEGSVTEPDGQPAAQNVQVRVLFKTQQPGDFVQRAGFTRPTMQNGKFVLSPVMPGSYVLVALETGRETRWAMQDVTIDGRDLANIDLTLEAARTVSGRVAFDGATAPPADLTLVRVSATSAQTGSAVTVSIPQAPLRADGTFTLTGFVPGRYRFSVTVPGAAWTLRSAMLASRDSADLPFEVKAGADLAGAVLTFTDRPTELSGTLFDAAGNPTPAFSIVVLPADKALWIPGARRIKAIHPASDGRYRILGLPAGEYFVAAMADFDAADLGDPAFLAQLAAASTKLTLSDGEKKIQDLRIGGTADTRRGGL
jgi:hypothetical protein